MNTHRPIRILVTGFGPFPQVHVNPTDRIARALAGQKKFRHMGLDITAHIFPTRWSVLTGEVERVIAAAKADAVLHLGVAARRKAICIETVARLGSRRLLPDASGQQEPQASPAGVTHFRIAAPAETLRVAIARTKAPVRLSNNAGRYLCNGLYAQSLQLRAKQSDPRPTVFIHIPMPAPKPGTVPKARRKTQRLSIAAMARALGETLPVLARQARHT